MRTTPIPLWPGLLIGAALAGFFDGIVLHQVLQWHHLICVETHCRARTVALLTRQNFQDGLFHAAVYAILLAGLVGLVRNVAGGRTCPPRRFWGAALLGAGAFNLVEGIVDHHILQIHHVRFGPDRPAWDLGFLVLSAALVGVGVFLVRRPAHGAAEPSKATPFA